ncbi:MAG: alpha-amylase family glycosyl hydrolase [Hadesarchaea archaeon]|nr:alpha-amylase family glycosyl hydrolase [Hadesarchaea archaeon]
MQPRGYVGAVGLSFFIKLFLALAIATAIAVPLLVLLNPGSEILPKPRIISPAVSAQLDNQSATFKWSYIKGLTYEIQIDDEPSFSSPLHEMKDLTRGSYSFTFPSRGEFYWRVRAVSGDRWGAWSSVGHLVIITGSAAPTLSSPANNAQLESRRVTFTWIGESGLIYSIEIDNESSFSPPRVHENPTVVENSYSHTFAADGTYYWRVQARDNAGNLSDWSSVWSLRILPTEDKTAPPTPLLLFPENNSTLATRTPTFRWTAVIDPSGVTYELILDDEPSFIEPHVYRKTDIPDNQHKSENLLADGTYYWRIRAKDGAGNYGTWTEKFKLRISVEAPLIGDNIFNEDDIIYQIMVDRFHDGDPTNNDFGQGEYNPANISFYHGGDWQGIIDKLPYIKNLGVTAIWISSVHHHQWLNKPGTSAGYHGYWTYDFYSPDPHFGTLGKLKELVRKASEVGIAVIIEAIPNHTGDYLIDGTADYDPNYGTPAPPFNNAGWYHHYGPILDWENEFQCLNYDMRGKEPKYGLDDLNQDIPEVRDELLKVYTYWKEEIGHSGYRVDASKHVPKWFLKIFQENLGIPCFGEAWYSDPQKLANHLTYEGSQHLWGTQDFPLMHAMQDVFASEQDFTRLSGILQQDYLYQYPNRLITFLDSHDMQRFLNTAGAGGERKLKLALTFMLASRGIPAIYYGTEQGLAGGSDPYNREDMPGWGETPVYSHLKRLCHVGKNYAPLRRGSQVELSVDTVVYAFRRVYQGEEIVAVFNNSWSQQTRQLTLPPASYLSAGTVLTNLLNTNDKITVGAGGSLSISLNAKEGKIYAANVTEQYTPPEEPTYPVTTIKVHYDVGYGNTIYIRGSREPLSWDVGLQAVWTEGNIWVWETNLIPAGETFEFKPLINDTTWSAGANYTGTGGQVNDVTPTF